MNRFLPIIQTICARQACTRPWRVLIPTGIFFRALCLLLLCAQFAPAGTIQPVYDEQDWRLAMPGWEYTFPSDHGTHDEFQTEWWYFTGHLREKGGGRSYAYQLTFFRQGITPPRRLAKLEKENPDKPLSAWRLKNIYFAHFAFSDINGNNFTFAEKVSRGTLGLAFYSRDQFWVQIGSWFARALPPLRKDANLRMEESFELSGGTGDISLRLRCTRVKPAVFHGKNGVSQKSAGPGRATHYYSMTRLDTEGTIMIGSSKIEVEGLSWFDKEFGTNQLDPEQIGWDWLSIQLDNGEEIMLYGIRMKDGSLSEFSSGTLIDVNGKSIHLKKNEFIMTPLRYWISPVTKASYPIVWTVEIPARGYKLSIAAALENSELNIQSIGRIDYWEGAINITGSKQNEPLKGNGFLEMTGYAQKLSTR